MNLVYIWHDDKYRAKVSFIKTLNHVYDLKFQVQRFRIFMLKFCVKDLTAHITFEPHNKSGYTEVQIILHFHWAHWALCGIFENGILLLYTLQGVSSVANFISAYEESQ